MRIGLFAAVASVLLLTTAAARGQTAPALIRVGVDAADSATPLLWARSAGLFTKAGIVVDVQRIAGGSNATTAVLAGTLEIVCLDSLTVILAHERDLGLSIIAPAAVYRSDQPDAALVVPAQSQRARARDFTDQAIGVAVLGDMTSLAARAWLDKTGSGNAVRLVEIGSAGSAALDDGRVAGVTLGGPSLAAALASRKVRVAAHVFDAIAPRYVESAYVARNEWILANRELVDRFLTVMREANAYVGAHEAETLPLIAGFLSRDPGALAQMARPARPADVDAAELQPLIALLARYQMIAKPFPAQQLIYPSALAPPRAPQRR
jgi:NitT/TauT family transport system substrate-binding protein